LRSRNCGTFNEVLLVIKSSIPSTSTRMPHNILSKPELPRLQPLQAPMSGHTVHNLALRRSTGPNTETIHNLPLGTNRSPSFTGKVYRSYTLPVTGLFRQLPLPNILLASHTLSSDLPVRVCLWGIALPKHLHLSEQVQGRLFLSRGVLPRLLDLSLGGIC